MTHEENGRRAALLGVALIALGCDAVQFATDPKPIFEQTWNLPVTSNKIWVKDLLPTNGTVTIPADSSAFSLTIDSTNITRVVGNDCTQCVTLNGTNAPKPAFTLNAGNSTALPQDIVAAAITSGTLAVRLVNNMSFDPLYVNTSPTATVQGHMVIVVRSGSVVLARDSVRGAATVVDTRNMPFAKLGGVLNRTIPLSTGTVTTNLTVDVTIVSPLGDHSEFINANGTLDASASVPTINVGNVTMNVPTRSLNSGNTDMDLSGIESSNIVQGTLSMAITNPFAGIAGSLTVTFADQSSGATLVSPPAITLPAGTGTRTVTLDSADIQLILGKKLNLSVTGSVSSPSPITVTPKLVVAIDNRLIVKLRTPSGGN